MGLCQELSACLGCRQLSQAGERLGTGRRRGWVSPHGARRLTSCLPLRERPEEKAGPPLASASPSQTPSSAASSPGSRAAGASPRVAGGWGVRAGGAQGFPAAVADGMASLQSVPGPSVPPQRRRGPA